MRVYVSNLSLGLSVHRVHLRARPPQGHPRPDPAVCDVGREDGKTGGREDKPSLSALRSLVLPSLGLTVLPSCELPLTELEPLPGARPTRLLALDGAGVAGHEARRPQLGPVLSVSFYQ